MHRLVVFLLLAANALVLSAQEDTLWTDAVLEEDVVDSVQEMFVETPVFEPPSPVAKRPVDSALWKKAEGSLDYSSDKAEPEPEPEIRQYDEPDLKGWHMASAGIFKLLQILAVVIALAGIAYGIYKMLQAPKNSKVRRVDVLLESDDLAEYLLDSDLDVWLREALKAGNYPLAVRILFLKTIKNLALGGHLELSKEKTNRDYLRELRNHPHYDALRRLTRRYEEVWFGNRTLDKAGYDQLAAEFNAVS
jgi:hypothetical protein